MTTTERHTMVMDAARSVHGRLGRRCPVERYEAALAEELRMRGIGIRDQKQTHIFFGGASKGVYLADIMIDGETLIEIRRTTKLTDDEKAGFGRFVDEIQYQRGYLVNFAGDDLEVEQFPPSSR